MGPFKHSYAAMPEAWARPERALPLDRPEVLMWNARLARNLGLDRSEMDPADPKVALALTGNLPIEGMRPVALAYAGHQFGHFSPQLGDGRALLLGELPHADGTDREIQLKGSGPTVFSRGGDGKCALGPALREYLVSEALVGLGIPTTETLAVIATGDTVWREEPLPGAIVVRSARSHLRVGTFEYFASRGDQETIARLLERAKAKAGMTQATLDEFLSHVLMSQAELIAQWMSVGFVHGVMNTDNMLLSGETIDFGPCAFLDEYQSAKVFSSIDRHGRYAFERQPAIGGWNLARLLESVLEQMEADAGAAGPAIERANAMLEAYRARCEKAFGERMAHKLGAGVAPTEFLQRLEREGSDYTLSLWAHDPGRNPKLIARNHRVEEAIVRATMGDLGPARRLADALAHPFEVHPSDEELTIPPEKHERVTKTFCGT